MIPQRSLSSPPSPAAGHPLVHFSAEIAAPNQLIPELVAGALAEPVDALAVDAGAGCPSLQPQGARHRGQLQCATATAEPALYDVREVDKEVGALLEEVPAMFRETLRVDLSRPAEG